MQGGDKMDWSPLLISIKTALTATLITFFLGILAADKILKTRGQVCRILDSIFTLPLVLPPTVAGFFLLVLFGKNGPLGRLFACFNIQIVFRWPATVIAAVIVAFPLMYRSAKAALEQVDENLIYAARTLGIPEIKIFWKITIPQALPGIISGGILAFTRALGEFGATIMIAGNIPKVTQTIPVAIYMAVQGNRTDRAAVWVILIVTMSFMVVYFLNYQPNRKKKLSRKERKE
jgi:molybdate transport system permease protein